MEKIFIVETSSEKEWEINTGFHIVSANSTKEAEDIIKNQFGKSIYDKKILSVKLVEDMLSSTNFATIIQSAEM